MQWRASIPDGLPILVEAPTWFLARREASLVFGVDPGALTVVALEKAGPGPNGKPKRCEHCGQVIRPKRAKR